MAYNIDPELLKEIQVTGITDADYERAAKYKEDIEHVEPLFYEGMYIFDYFKMDLFCVSPQGKSYFNIAKDDLVDYVFGHINQEDNNVMWKLTGKCQEFVKLLPEKERKNYVFNYTTPHRTGQCKNHTQFQVQGTRNGPRRAYMVRGLCTDTVSQ